MKKKISIKNLYLIALISIGLIGLGIGSTYAVFTASATIENPITFTSTLSYTSDVIETVEVTIAPGETKYTTLDITNSNDTALNYAVWYIDEGKDIDLGVDIEQATEDMCPNITTCTGFESGTPAFVAILIRNNTSSTITVTVGVSASIGNIVLDDNMTIYPNQELPAATTALSNFTYLLDSYDYRGDGSLVFDIPDGHVLLTEYIGTDTEVDVASSYTIDGVEYTPIVFGDGLQELGTFVYNTNVSDVSFQDGVVFAEVYNEESFLLNSASYLFYNCTSLTKVSGIANVTKMESTFYGCSSLVEIDNIPEGVTSLLSAFYNCSEINVIPNIPSSVNNLKYAFRGCAKLTSVPAIPSSVTNLFSAFRDCAALVNAPIINSTADTWSYLFYGCTSLKTVPAIPNTVTNLSYTFYHCTALTEMPTIPNGVTNLYRTFASCTSLATLSTIPSSVTDMTYTFYNCKALTEMPTIPNGVTILSGSFSGCSSLVTFSAIPSSVTDMTYTFNNCTNLTGTLNIESTIVSLASYVFNNTSKDITVVVPSGSTTYSSFSALTAADGMPSNVTLTTSGSSTTT
ncbi:MAG: leucine-rich repeat protein [Bacilli bacterium]|nr:leucine-rich repeat protein [Bacilli bacterium]